ncbi:MAG: energy-coupling factor transporter ATPase, partial [Clostridia bacterium]|nr:energy-coupling factor transporter ATPase [Clostridia bacterium]
PAGRREVMDTIIRLNREFGITVLHITHYMNEAAMCDRVVVINDGNIEFDDTPARVFTHVERLQEIGLDMPQTVELAWELNRVGANLPLESLSVEKMADEIMNMFEETAK